LRLEFEKEIKELQIERMKFKELQACRMKVIKEMKESTLRNDGSNKRHIYKFFTLVLVIFKLIFWNI